MQSAFQDRENLYILMDYRSGGDLRYHMNHKENYNEDQASI